MEPRRVFLGHRAKGLHAFFMGARVVFFLGLVPLFAFGQSVPAFAGGFLLLGVTVMLLDAIEHLLPGRLLRPTAATVGEDGVQTPEGFLGWHQVRQLREVVATESAEERRARVREEREARRDRRATRHPRRMRYVVIDLHEEVGFRKWSVRPHRVRAFLEEATERLRRRPEAHDAADYRSAPEREHEDPRDAALDTALEAPKRVAAFLSLSAAERETVLAAMADEKGREVFTRRGG